MDRDENPRDEVLDGLVDPPPRRWQSALSASYLFIAVFGLWMAASGPYSLPGLTEEGSWLLLSAGLVASVGVVALCWRLGIVDPENVPLHLTWRTLRYVPWLALQVVLSNLDVMRRIWLRGERIDPVVVKVQASQKTDLGRVTYANSITLTPGTLTVDAMGAELTVHSIAREVAAGLDDGEMDRRIAWLEGGVPDEPKGGGA